MRLAWSSDLRLQTSSRIIEVVTRFCFGLPTGRKNVPTELELSGSRVSEGQEIPEEFNPKRKSLRSKEQYFLPVTASCDTSTKPQLGRGWQQKLSRDGESIGQTCGGPRRDALTSDRQPRSRSCRDAAGAGPVAFGKEESRPHPAV